MKNYFAHMTAEFLAKSQQITQFVSAHGPTIGSAHEILIRSFLSRYLPKWVSTGHGFIAENSGAISRECDVIIYDSNLYAPLYQIDDFVVVPPEAVVAVVEIKKNLTRHLLSQSLQNLSSIKRASGKIQTSIFCFNPPTGVTVGEYIAKSEVPRNDCNNLPDFIYGLNRFVFERATVQTDKKGLLKIGYVTHADESVVKGTGYVVERFFHNIYSHIEMRINQSLKDGIDNVWVLDSKSLMPKGRLRYSGPQLLSTTKAVAIFPNSTVRLPEN